MKSMKSSSSVPGGSREGGQVSVTKIEKMLTMFNPEDFLSSSEKVSVVALQLLKNLYDYTKFSENSASLDDPLGLQAATLKTPVVAKLKKKKKRQSTISKAEAPVPTLVTEDFDEDQIWEEVELQNGLLYDNLVTSVSKLLAYQEKPLEDGDDSSDNGNSSEDDEVEVNPLRQASSRGREGPAGASIEEDSDFFESDEKYRRKSAKQVSEGKQYKKSIVDDRFFSLAQMTEHIEQVEAEMEKEEAKRSGLGGEENEDESSDDDSDSVDMFEDIPSEEEEGVESAEYYYKDFFDPPLKHADPDDFKNDEAIEADVEEEAGSNEEQLGQDQVNDDDDEESDIDDEKEQELEDELSRKKSVTFNLEEHEDSDEEDDEVEGENKLPDNVEGISEDDEEKAIQNKQLGKKINETLSTFEKRKKQIADNIEEMENASLEPKAWHLLGEATAESRPENALLEEHLAFDHLLRPAPEITVETTHKLEDVIKRRIKDGAWDDVQRKVKPVENPREFKKRLVLDAEKSKASLAEIYEQEYLGNKKTDAGEVEEKDPEEHTQIKKDLDSLFSKLDALSHYHYTPKPPSADVKVVANLPAISMEDVAPVNVSDATLLAPQEIQDHVNGPIKGKAERTDTDRKRERRKKKKKQHLKRLSQEEKARLKGLGLKNIKLADAIVKSQKKANIGKEGYDTSQQTAKELKSSKAFFAKLQESVSSHINTVAKRKNVSNDTSKLSAKKLKL